MLLDIEPGDSGSNSIDLEDEFNFDRRVERKGVDADCGTSVSASVAEDLDEKIAGSVGHLGLGIETIVALDEDADPHHSPKSIELTIE